MLYPRRDQVLYTQRITAIPANQCHHVSAKVDSKPAEHAYMLLHPHTIQPPQTQAIKSPPKVDSQAAEHAHILLHPLLHPYTIHNSSRTPPQGTLQTTPTRHHLNIKHPPTKPSTDKLPPQSIPPIPSATRKRSLPSRTLRPLRAQEESLGVPFRRATRRLPANREGRYVLGRLLCAGKLQ